ncbi:MAG: 30S ribosomal protein S8 [Candidatus Pacearchaeota archaeon]
MSQDIISDALNNIMNAKKSGKIELKIAKFSNVLNRVLEIAKKEGYIESFKVEDKKMEIKIGKLIECKSIKPRHNVSVSEIDKYMRRYLPARGIGIIIISTNKGLMTHAEALEQNIGGVLIAYFY